MGRLFSLVTLGCQMNVHDSERMADALRAHGWAATEHVEEAELVVVNTCSVREKAEQKLRSLVGRLAEHKATNPGLVIAVTGCVAQQEGEALVARMRHVDLVLGPDNLGELPALVEEQLAGAPPRVRTVFDLEAPTFLGAAPRAEGAPASVFVTTMKGCDERCSFCIVPYTRGPERYRPAVEIVAEVRRWIAAGALEVTLLGQTVDSYRDPDLPPPASANPDESQFPSLLRRLAAEPGLQRLRYTSPHPRHLTPSLVAAHEELSVLARHVHMPVQSGSDRVLKRMIRRYTRREYVERVGHLRRRCPDITVSTDIIVGFPGETRSDFAETLSLVEEIGFSSLFGFKYSRRPLTPANRLADDVSEEEKAERLAQLFEVGERLTRAHLETLVGTEQQVLFDGIGKGGASAQGRTAHHEIVHVHDPRPRSLLGRIAAVTVRKANKHSLVGELRETDRASAEGAPEAVRPPRRTLTTVSSRP